MDRELMIAVKLMWSAYQMKPTHRLAGVTIARVYCNEVCLPADKIERVIVDNGATRGGTTTLEEVQAIAEKGIN